MICYVIEPKEGSARNALPRPGFDWDWLSGTLSGKQGGFPLEESNRSVRGVRFGVFEVDLRSGELRKQGLKIKLQGQPIQILALLLERPGDVVTREEIQKKLWPADTFVDFEHGLNAAIKKLRAALGDSADSPRFVETLHGRGYRFIAPVEGCPAPPISPSPPAPAGGTFARRALPVAGTALAVVGLVAVLIGLNVGGLREQLLSGVAPGQITSLAVLPLENLSGDPEQEYFADGMTEALITELGKISALRVISRQSVMQFKGTDKPLPEIARELEVDAVVEGSVLRAGKQVRITVQLMRAEPEEQLWSQSYQRDLSEILVLQSEVARAIAREIKIALTPEEETRLAIVRKVSPAAHEAYLKGRFHWSTRTRRGTEKAIEYFEQARDKDPDYALAYVGLADCYHGLHEWGGLPRKPMLAKARAAVQKALTIDNKLGEAHATLAWLMVIMEWDWSGAEEHFKQALKLNSSYPRTHDLYAMLLTMMGRHEEAIAEGKQAQELDPFSVLLNVRAGEWYYFARQYDRAIEEYLNVVDFDPNAGMARWGLGKAYVQKGMYEEAIAEIQKIPGGQDDFHAAMVRDFALGYAYG
ncbi:MAG: tetratricopeptide repeat protein, partial [Acidobacteria bacterium]|nr:tetratricopeptide repeat protein [Acidobacteriota bacterium]